MPRDRPNDIRWIPWVVPNGGIDESRSDHELPPNKWAQALDVEPLPTGCRTRQGTEQVNAVALSAVAIQNVTGTDDRTIGNGTVDYVAQRFTGTATTAANRLSKIAVRIKQNTGTPTQGVQLKVVQNSGGEPGSAITGLAYDDFNTVTAATINAAGGYTWIYFTVPADTDVFLANGTSYHVVIKAAGGDGSHNFALQESNAGDPYAGGVVHTSQLGVSTWSAAASADIWFRVYAGAAVPIQGILDYNLSDASTERLLVVAGGHVYKEASGVLTPVDALEPELMTGTGADVHPALSVGNDTAFISNGTDDPKKFFIRSATEHWANDGIEAPTDAGSSSVSAGGTVPDDVGYYLDYYFWDDDLQIQSNSKYQGLTDGNPLVETTSGGNNTIVLSGLPATVERDGDRATHIRVSIKLPTSGVFRYSGVQVTLGTTVATISSLSAMTNEPTYDNEVAPNHTIATVGANQRFIAGMSSYPYRVQASKLSIIAPYYESFPPLNYRDFGRGDGDYVTALAFIPPATLIVGMKNSIWALDARRFLTGDPVLISKNVGIAGPHAFMVAGRTLYFLSDSDRIKGMMVWNGAEVRPLLAIDSTLKNCVPARLRFATCAHNSPGDGRFQWWTLLTGSGTAQNRVIMYDYALDAFSVYRITGNVLGTAAVSGGLATVKMGTVDGELFDADTGTTDDGTAISATFTAKRDDFGFPDAVKRIRFVRAEADGSTESNLRVTFEPDIQGFPSFAEMLDFTSDAGSFLGTGILGSFILGSGEQVISTRVGLNGVCRNAQPTFSSSTRWNLRGYSLGAQILRRR